MAIKNENKNTKKPRRLLSWIIVIAVLLLIICLWFIFDIQSYLSLDYIKSQHLSFKKTAQQSPISTSAIYISIYIIVTALSLPGGAVILTLLGGAIFGFWLGLIFVSFSSTIGATIACLTSRFLLKDWVQKKYSARLQTVNKGIQEQGAFYLFTLRLIPIAPFFMVNLLMGLTPIRISTFFIVSQIGMLAGSAVYVNAGTQLGKITDISEIVSPQILLSFVLLGIFPWIAKIIIKIAKKLTSNKANT